MKCQAIFTLICVLSIPTLYAENEENLLKTYEQLQSDIEKLEHLLENFEAASKSIASKKKQSKRHEIDVFFEAKSHKVSVEQRKNRIASIVALEKFVRRHPKNERLTPDALFRLGNLYFEKEQEEYFDNFSNLSEIKSLFLDSERVLRTLLKNFPQYKKRDLVRYVLGTVLRLQGEDAKALVQWEDLLRETSESHLIPEVTFRAAEGYFHLHKLPQSKKYYEKIIRLTGHKFQSQAYYKLAWIFYLQSDYRTSIETFLKVFESGEENRATMLDDEAKTFIAHSLFELGNKNPTTTVDLEKKLMQDIPTELRSGILINLSEMFSNALFFRESANTLMQGIQLNPMDSANAELCILAMKKMREAGEKEEVYDLELQFVEQFGLNSDWYAFQEDHELKEKTLRNGRQFLTNLATRAHQGARDLQNLGNKDESKEKMMRAASFYQQLLSSEPSQKERTRTLELLAEVAFVAEKYELSAESYAELWGMRVPKPLQKKAALGAILAREANLKSQQQYHEVIRRPEDPSGRFSETLDRREIPQVFVPLLEALAFLVSHFPKDGQAPTALLKMSLIYDEYGQRKEADALIEQLWLDFPRSKASLWAANSVLSASIEAEKWEQSQRLATRFTDQIFGKEVHFKEALAGIQFKHAEVLLRNAHELEGDARKYQYLLAAKEFLAAVDAVPSAQFADKALFNAALAFKSAGKQDKSAALMVKIERLYPSSDAANVGRYERAIRLETEFQFDEAAALYLEVLKQEPTHSNRREILLTVAELHEAGKNKNSAEEFLNFSHQYPTDPRSIEAQERALNIFLREQNFGKARQLYRDFLSTRALEERTSELFVEANLFLGQHALEEKKWAKAHAYFKRAVGIFDQFPNEFSKYNAAKAQFRLIDFDYNAYMAKKLNGRSGKLQKKQLTQKTKLLVKLRAEYEGLVKKYKHAVWNMGALYRIGKIYQNLFDSLTGANCPNDIKKAKACGEYQNLLEDKAAVLEEKAIAAFTQALEVSRDHNLKLDWVEYAEVALSRLDSTAVPIQLLSQLPTIGVPQFSAVEDVGLYKNLVLSRRYAENGNPVAARYILDKISVYHPRDKTIKLLQGYLAFEGKRFEDARKYFEEVITMNPDDVQGHLRLGITLFSMGNNSAATNAFRQVKKLDPNNRMVPIFVGLIAYQGRKYREAVGEFNTLVIQDPRNIRHATNRALVHVLTTEGNAIEQLTLAREKLSQMIANVSDKIERRRIKRYLKQMEQNLELAKLRRKG